MSVADVTQLELENESLRDEISDLEEQIEGLQSEVYELEEEVADLKSELDRYTSTADKDSIVSLCRQGLQVNNADEKQWFLERVLIKLDTLPTALIYEPSRQPHPMP